MLMKVPFVKGHMGGDEIILLWDQIPKSRELEAGIAVIRPPINLGVNELGLIYKTEKKNILKVKMIWKLSEEYIEMCGGLTQVLGKALIEVPNLANYFNIEVKEPLTKIAIETDVGLIFINVEIEKGRVKRVLTDMTSYVNQCYKEGVKRIQVLGIDAMKVGEYLVANVDEIKKRYPHIKPEEMDKDTLEILEEMQVDWDNKRYSGTGFALYDLHPGGKGNARAVFPQRARERYIDSTCGTGTTAIGIAVIEKEEVKIENSTMRLLFETGGKPVMGGPELSELMLDVREKMVVGAQFSHNLIETLATGEVWIKSK